MVLISTEILPPEKPRYVMGVGFAVDLVICCALGADMFDCVFPTRTAVRLLYHNLRFKKPFVVFNSPFIFQRFGCALIPSGQLNLRLHKYRDDITPIDSSCQCSTCKRYTRAYLHSIVTVETVACHLLTVHNLYFQVSVNL